jgi:DNA primase
MRSRSLWERRIWILLVPSTTTREWLERASRTYHDQLTPAAVEYLTARGLTEEVIARFRLGVVNDPLPSHDKYQGKLVIPYLTNYGPTTLRFRRLGDGEGTKYLTLAGDIPRIFNPQALERGTRAICVSEGEIDCITAEMCDLPCIGIPGTQSWQPLWTKLLGQYESVFLLQDDGDAGKAMADKLSKFLSHNLRPIVMTGDDVNYFFLQHGREALRAKVGASN